MRSTATRLLRLGTSLALVSASAATVASNAGSATSPTTQTFDYTGSAQAYTVPDDVCSIRVDALGAQGGGGTMVSFFTMAAGGHTSYFMPDPGGMGGEAVSVVTVHPGESLQVNVGGHGGTGDDVASQVGLGGWNGGGDAGRITNDGGTTAGGGGGGASDVRQGGTELTDRVVVAGGGGGRGDGSLDTVGQGGVGGNPATAGSSGSQQSYSPIPNEDGSVTTTAYGTGPGGGGAGSADAAGTAGSAGSIGAAQGASGLPGSLGIGGGGATDPTVGGNGGGGGGGLMGGGGGGSGAGPDAVELPQYEMWDSIDGGGGGGSSLGDSTTPGVREGDGQVTITPLTGTCSTDNPPVSSSTSTTSTPAPTTSMPGGTAVAATPVAAAVRYTG